jgi:hypothetical protein
MLTRTEWADATIYKIQVRSTCSFNICERISVVSHIVLTPEKLIYSQHRRGHSEHSLPLRTRDELSVRRFKRPMPCKSQASALTFPAD